MKGAIEKDSIPRFGMLVDNMLQQKIVKDNFLNLFCALSFVILSVDCSAIVFLHVNFNEAFCLISNFKHRCMSSSKDFLECTITKKVEEH